MKGKSYQKILVLIVLTAIVLIAAQGYFTVQNYRVNQQRFVNDVQIALDLSIEKYYSDKARTSIQVLTMDVEKDTVVFGHQIKASFSTTHGRNITEFKLDSVNSGFSYRWSSSSRQDSIFLDSTVHRPRTPTVKKFSILNDDEALSYSFQQLTDKVLLSFAEDLLDLDLLHEAVRNELERKNLTIDFVLYQNASGTDEQQKVQSAYALTTSSKSSYLGNDRAVRMNFENATLRILQRGISDLILSVLIIALVLGTMLYLYRTINRQKQLAEIKDDLLGNITHEFKTPIATIFSALEGVTNFNEANDPEKTKKYLSISNDQLKKLNSMVEKLLETATIDKGKLKLNLEEVELVGWTQAIVERFEVAENGKSIQMDFEMESSVGEIDVFHLENALANLIDNAIKYGGDQILVRMKTLGSRLVWEVEDNGGNIPAHAKERIFEKLYRVPKGNTHDVKGFGIGLYYAKTIAELHEGELTLELTTNKTLFSLTL